MKKVLPIIVILVVAFVGAWYLSMRQDQQAIERAQVLPAPEPEPEPPAVAYPVEEIEVAPPAPETEPLPPLEESDGEVLERLQELAGAEAVDRFFLQDMLVNRLVATADSLTSAQVAPLMLPLHPVEGKFMVLGDADATVISPQNAARYDALVAWVEGVDSRRAVALYVRYYPLLQEAYTSLGYPDAHFNDRLVAVIDHLLESPEPEGPVGLVPSESVWAYADPELEALSAGQKILVRMGRDHARAVKDKLREVRTLITGPGQPAQ